MPINDILSLFLMFFSLFMAGSSARANNIPRAVIWVLVAGLNAFAIYLSERRRARREREAQDPIDVASEILTDESRGEEEREEKREEREEEELARADDEDAQDEFDEEDADDPR